MMMVAASAVAIELRMPYSSWVNTSRPRPGSMPNQKSPSMPPYGAAGMVNMSSRSGLS